MPVRVSIRRHSNRPKEAHAKEVNLTYWGKVKSFLIGVSLGIHGINPKIYTSPFNRTQETGRLIARGSGSKYAQRTRKELGFTLLRSTEFAEQYKSLLRDGEDMFLAKWLANQVNPKICFTPHEVALRVVRTMKIIPKGVKRLSRMKNVDIEGISHAPHILALFYELTQKPVEAKDFLKFNQAIKIEFGEKVILTHRDRRYDVTKKFNALLQEK